MATDLERLVLQIEANTRGLERSLKRVESQVDGSMKRAGQSTKTFNSALDGAAVAARGLVAVFAAAQGLRGFQQLIDGATRIENALKVAGLSGDDLTAVYDRLFASAQRNAAPIETLVQLYSRAATVQNELGVSSEELLGFTDRVALALRVAGTDAQTASGALLQLSQALGAGTVRAEEFNSILEGALPIAQAAAAGLDEAGGSVAKLRQLVVDGEVSSSAFFRAFEAGSVILEQRVADAESTVSQQFIRLQNVLQDTAGKFNDMTGTGDAVGSALEELAGIIEGLGNAMVAVADSDFAHFTRMLAEPLRLINEFRDKIGGLRNLPAFLGVVNGAIQDRVRGITPDDRRIQNRIDQAFEPSEADGKTTRLPQLTATDTVIDRISTADYPVGGTGGGSRGRGGGGRSGRSAAATEAERQAEAIQRVIESLRFEQEQLGRTDEQQRIHNELKRAGVELNSEAGQQISALVSEIERQEQATRKAAEAQEELNDIAMDAFYDLAGAIDTGNEAMDRFLSTLIEAAAQAAILGEGPLAGLFSGFRGGGFKANTTLGSFLGVPSYANGTDNHPGGLAWVGERGRELVRMPEGSQVIPNHDIAGLGGSSISAPVSISIDARGADSEGLERVQGQLSRLEAELPARITQQVRQMPRDRIRA